MAKEIVRRLLIAIGGLVAAAGLLLAVALIYEGDELAMLGLIAAPLGFWGWYALVNWILVYTPIEKEPQELDF